MKSKNFIKLSSKRKKAVIQFAIKHRWSYGKFTKRYKQPSWCCYPDALSGSMGCWSLMGYGPETKKWFKDKCSTCDQSKGI